MTTKEGLHQLVDRLTDDQAELARHLLEDLRDSVDEETLASLDRGLADVAEGRTKSLEQYEHERGL